MPRAYVDLKDTPHYRLTSFINGFARLGFLVRRGAPDQPLGPDDAVVVWNRMGRSLKAETMAREGGAALIVAENGYHGKDADGIQSYALALDGHNGSGRWFVGDDERLKALRIDFKPWRVQQTGKFLIAAQRGIGSPLMRSPPHFAERLVERVEAQGMRAYIRPHPGQHTPPTTLLQDLEDKEGLLVWSSNAATQALIHGVPVHYMAPSIVTRGAAKRLTTPFLWNSSADARPEAFQRMAWAQWFLSEIASGEALRTLLDVHQGKLPSVQEGFGI
ncbi:hypothetical protein CcrC1_gp163 [Caulobacter phage C1]|nr:hypothetical protein CcrC1_gp163 [Caulobacter phage C1]UTU08392.1 hypothetical protein CcrC2_gp164 [Caulobacter phage C2]UTU08909.1 hypothetical protein CcrJ4_gp158 [Caulobacter phage J4]UTU10025.1 hypothetical protein CcrRB23_gp163 [Caulobacter phage RB23]WGN97060.1 hypothetical protein [Bertelyvirus sp.]